MIIYYNSRSVLSFELGDPVDVGLLEAGTGDLHELHLLAELLGRKRCTLRL